MFQTSPIVAEFPDCSNQGACRAFLREFEKLLLGTYRPQIVFDMSQVSQMNALGIDLMLRCIGKIASYDGDLRLAGASPETALVLELAQVSDVVEVFNTVPEALESFDSNLFAESVRRDSRTPAA
jgi:anti-anti-sigma regulatory factor